VVWVLRCDGSGVVVAGIVVVVGVSVVVTAVIVDSVVEVEGVGVVVVGPIALGSVDVGAVDNDSEVVCVGVTEGDRARELFDVMTTAVTSTASAMTATTPAAAEAWVV
jgi:uncharacterized membrane protein